MTFECVADQKDLYHYIEHKHHASPFITVCECIISIKKNPETHHKNLCNHIYIFYLYNIQPDHEANSFVSPLFPAYKPSLPMCRWPMRSACLIGSGSCVYRWCHTRDTLWLAVRWKVCVCTVCSRCSLPLPRPDLRHARTLKRPRFTAIYINENKLIKINCVDYSFLWKQNTCIRRITQ